MLLGAWAGRQTAGADERHRGVPGSPGVETSPSSARGVGLIPGSHVPRGQNTKTIRQKQYWSTSKKDFLNGPHQKKTKKIFKRETPASLTVRSAALLQQPLAFPFTSLPVLSLCQESFPSFTLCLSPRKIQKGQEKWTGLFF